jgi:hypothetical protein
MADSDDDNEIQLAEEIIDGRKCDNTKTQYRRKFEHFRQWILMKYPECAADDGYSVELSSIKKKHILDFLGYICRKKDKGGDFLEPTVYQTFQHVSGYKSAIKDYFSNKNCELGRDTEKISCQGTRHSTR